MPRTSYNIMTFRQANDFLGNRSERKLKGNTWIRRNTPNTICIRFHNTDIVQIHANDTYTLNSGGYHTVTTKARINEYSPVCLGQKNFEWFLYRHNFALSIEFYDGITVDNTGKPIA